jgi:uncharacterized repeat protein (TIGR03803 family)
MQIRSCLRGSTAFIIFALAIGTATGQTVSEVADFSDAIGCSPVFTTIAQGRDGNLYTTLPYCDSNNNGSVVKITPQGTLTVLYSFDGTHGSLPFSGLTLGSDGNFYGTTWGGGSANGGTIFKITPTGILTVLHNFLGGSDGDEPIAAPVQASDGNFYGTTSYSGATPQCGTLYKMTPSGTVTKVHDFNYVDGCRPFAVLTEGSDGWLYGTTRGANYPNQYEFGNTFKITKAGAIQVLYSFDGTDGAQPTSPLIEGSDGYFYGTTSRAGTALGRPFNHGGTLFNIAPSGSLNVLHNFNPSPDSGDGYYTTAGLLQATNGTIYGSSEWGGTSSAGDLFSLALDGSYSVFFDFWLSDVGYYPSATMLQHTNGFLYGATNSGSSVSGSRPDGVLFSVDIGASPFVTTAPSAGWVGETVGVLGQGFKMTKSVSFNGVPAAFTVVSDTYLRATVPAGATTGSVAVTTPTSQLTSNKNFRVTQ